MPRGGELHAGLAECITGREVVGCVDLNRNDPLTQLGRGQRFNVLPEGTAHALRNTVSAGTGGLLVFAQHVVGEGVDTEGVPLCTGFLTDGGVGNDTSRLEGGVANLNVVVRTKFEDDLELPRLRSTSVSDVVLMDTVVRPPPMYFRRV